MTKTRIDKMLIARGLAQSRERAKVLIGQGRIRVAGRVVDKPGTSVALDAHLQIQGEDFPYVSRGGLKLEGGLATLGVDPAGMVVMDIGASTGGFTDCVLQKGATRVYAVDVGCRQLAPKLRRDPRVINLERRNARYLSREEVREEVDLILIDTSFISVEKFLPHLPVFLKEGGLIICLVKPQFEVGKGGVGRSGIVRDPRIHQKVIHRISEVCKGLGLSVVTTTESPLLGLKGNKEFFILLRRGA